MRPSIFLVLLAICSISANCQITVELSSLPNIGDRLSYQLVAFDSLAKVDNQVFLTGADQNWDFQYLEEGTPFTEYYEEVQSGTIADSFPDANLRLPFLGLQGFGRKNTTDVSVIGVAGDSILGFPIPIIAQLSNPFIVRRAPFGYEDQFSTNTSFQVVIDANGLDSIQFIQDLINGIPGTTIDSLRATINIDRSEVIDGWGMISIPTGDYSCLKSTQTDVISTQIEVYAITFAGSGWVDLAPFLPLELQDLLSVASTNVQFFADTKKEVLASFTYAPDSTLLSARYADDQSSSLFEAAFENKVEVEVFPNPVSSMLSIRSEDYQPDQAWRIQIFDSSGKAVWRDDFDGDDVVDLSQVVPGSYFLKITEQNQLIYRTVLVVAN